VAVQPAIEGEASFQIYGGARGPGAQVGFIEGFTDGSHPVQGWFHLFHGETHAVMADALVRPQVPGQSGFYPKNPVSALGIGLDYSSNSFNNSGEHGANFAIYINFRIPGKVVYLRPDI
jgi:hypothetical protein